MYELKGDVLSIGVDGLGAELKSLKKNATGHEYMWSADPAFWNKTSPVLFPFVGRMNGQQYNYKGKTYTAALHGFAKDMEFKLLERTEDTLRFGITDTEETRANYPFTFEFEIIYKLKGNQVEVTYIVNNTGDEEMLFSLGGHPGFVCPPEGDTGKRADCFIRFEHTKKGVPEKVVSRGVDLSVGLVNDEYTDYILDNGDLPIADDLFKGDALVLEGNQVNRVSLLDSKRIPYVTLDMEAPIYGIWSCLVPGAPYVCIEPWLGRCDAVGFDGNFEDREYQNTLAARDKFITTFTITIA